MKEDKPETKLSMTRREFIRKGGAAVAGGVAAATVGSLTLPGKAEGAPIPKKWDRKADVVIVGTGGAGMCAAIEAAKAGARVLVLEKEPITGGSSAICGGQFAFAPTAMQRERGIKDSTDMFFSDLMKIGQNRNDPKLVRAYVDASADCYDFLSSLGVKFETINIFAGFSVPRAHYSKPSEILKTLKTHALSKGVTILTGTSAERLIVNGSGRVVGVLAADSRKEKINVMAAKAVILASGGFGRNPEMLEEFSNMALGQCIPINGPGSTGDGHRMAMEIGSGTKHISLGIGPSCPTDVSTNFITMPMYQGAVILNKEGQRFVNESISYLDVASEAVKQTEALALQIGDAKVYEAAMKDALSNKGAPKKAASLEELAPMIGLDPKVLREAIDRYNRNVDSGKDPDFKRTTLVGISGKPFRIETPPFYGFVTKPSIISNKGGLKVNERTQVLKVFGEVIPGLYAPGEIMGGVHGAGYHTGSAVGKALVFGRIAGKFAAEEKPWA